LRPILSALAKPLQDAWAATWSTAERVDLWERSARYLLAEHSLPDLMQDRLLLIRVIRDEASIVLKAAQQTGAFLSDVLARVATVQRYVFLAALTPLRICSKPFIALRSPFLVLCLGAALTVFGVWAYFRFPTAAWLAGRALLALMVWTLGGVWLTACITATLLTAAMVASLVALTLPFGWGVWIASIFLRIESADAPPGAEGNVVYVSKSRRGLRHSTYGNPLAVSLISNWIRQS
jgi:hypothetical protein